MRFGNEMRAPRAPQTADTAAGTAGPARVLVATDAWHPQVNGVVRTLMSLAESARRLGVASSS